jgi:L-ribulose-5-phosphate 3-epimerase
VTARRIPSRSSRPSRRDVLRTSAAAITAGPIVDIPWGASASAQARFSLGACDWSIGMRARPEALALARKLGLDGAQVSMGNVENVRFMLAHFT